MKKLKNLPSSMFFSKEAGSIRGIPDILGSVGGIFVALEVKRSLEEAKKYHPRSALQKKFIADTIKTGGYASLIYPENETEILEEICNLLTRA